MKGKLNSVDNKRCHVSKLHNKDQDTYMYTKLNSLELLFRTFNSIISKQLTFMS